MRAILILWLSLFIMGDVFAATTPMVYTEDKLGIMVQKEQPEFQIKLQTNQSTGYSWYLRDYNESLLTPLKRIVIAPETKMMGSPGYEVWTFRVNKKAFVVPQQMLIRLVYARPWDANDQSKQLIYRVST